MLEAFGWLECFGNGFDGTSGCLEIVGVSLGELIFKEVPLNETIYLCSHHEEWPHEVAVLHDLGSVGSTLSQLLSVNVIGAGNFPPLVSSEDFQDVHKRIKLNGWGVVVESVDDHPLADEEVSADRERTGQYNISGYADEGSKAQRVAHVGLQKGNVVLIVGPFSEVIEDGVEETVHDGQHPGEIDLVEEAEQDEENADGSIERHSENERLNLVAYVGDGVDLLPDVQLRNDLFCLLSLPNNNFLGQLGGISIVKTQVDECPDKRQTHDDPTENREAQPPQHVRDEGGDYSSLDN